MEGNYPKTPTAENLNSCWNTELHSPSQGRCWIKLIASLQDESKGQISHPWQFTLLNRAGNGQRDRSRPVLHCQDGPDVCKIQREGFLNRDLQRSGGDREDKCYPCLSATWAGGLRAQGHARGAQF